MTWQTSNENLLTLVRLERERRRRAAPADAGAPEFRGAADKAQSITARSWFLSGPAETGKTWGGLYRLDTEARKWENSQWVLSRKVRTTMYSTVLNTWRRIIALRGGVTVFGGEHPSFYTYPNGARVWIVGFDNPDKILSGEFDGAYVNQAEELEEEDFETLTTRTTGRGAKTDTPMVWGDCNPGPEDHWIIRRRDAGTLTLLESYHEDNPTLHNGTTWTEQGIRALEVLDSLTGVRYLRLRKGLWVGAEGQYFAQLDEHVHLLKEPTKHTAAWSLWAALDYGFHHPLAFGVFGQAPSGGIIMLGRHVQHKWYIPQHCDAMDSLLDSMGIDKRGLRIVAGHDCWATGKDDPETIADKFARRGYILERAIISRIIGARAVGERLGNPEASVNPTLLFDPQCRPTFLALSRMVHDPRNSEDVLKVSADAEGRGGDDEYDMVRYGVMAAAQATTVHRPAPVVNRWRQF